jgi:predicted transglutaminase-like cysteine proteinase
MHAGTKHNKLWGIAIILATVAGNAGAAAATGEPFMMTGSQTSQPVGHYEFCLDHRAECNLVTTGDPRVRLTPARWKELTSVNATVNRTIAPATDMAVYGRTEVWAYPTTRGDCEDVALLKRRDLIEKGWPVGALLMTVVRQPNGDGHAVLTVLTDRGDLVLDNLETKILVWNETDYQFVKRQSEFDAGQWVAIDDAHAAIVGSLKR